MLRWTHIGENQAAALVRGVALDHLLAHAASLCGFKRPLDALARRVIKPAVIGATNVFPFHETVQKRCAAMRTTFLYEQHVAATGARQHEVLAQNAHTPGLPRFAQLRRVADWMPVAAQQVAAGRIRPDASEQLIRFMIKHWYTSLRF